MAKKDIPIEILEAAKELFCKYGFKRISIEDICNHAKVSRRTFYVYYENKTNLLIRLLEYKHEEISQGILAIKNSELPFPEKLIQIINYRIAELAKMSPEFLADIHDPSFVEVRQYYESKRAYWSTFTHAFLSEAQKRGEIRADLDVDFLQQFINQSMASFKDAPIKKNYPDPAIFMRKIADLLFYGILGKN